MNKLTAFPRVPYTMLEHHLFELLPPRGGRITSAEIAAGRAELGKWEVENPLRIVTTTMDRLIGKVRDNREAFRIRKERREDGRHMLEYWITPV